MRFANWSYSQGDGSALILKDEPNLFTFSVHSEKNFPFRKQESDLDLSLDDGVEDKEYLDILQVSPGISRVMDCAAKFPPLLPEIEMSYKHRFENKVY